MRVKAGLSAGLMVGAFLAAGTAITAITAGPAAAQTQMSADLRPHIAASSEFSRPAAAPVQTPVQAPVAIPTTPNLSHAQAIRSLNIMLMVTSLRCRGGAHDFRSEYDMFARAHQQNLEDAHSQLTGAMVAAYGEEGSHRALDRIGVSLANQYGDGHPTMGCLDLKEATLELAMSQDRAALAATAARLLEGKLPRSASALPRPTITPQWTQAEPEAAATPESDAPSLNGNVHQNRAKTASPFVAQEPVRNQSVEAPQSEGAPVPNWLRG